jgi:hypothetical protein
VVDTSEVTAQGEVVGADVEADADGFENAAADDILQGVVAEQPEVAGAAAGGDAGTDRLVEAEGRSLGEAVEIGTASLAAKRAASRSGRSPRAARSPGVKTRSRKRSPKRSTV